MRLTSINAPEVRNRSVVYFLYHRGGRRFKIGFSQQIKSRKRGLPEASEIDEISSFCVAFESAKRAREVEQALKRLFADQRVYPGHRGSGHTEWFAMEARHTVVWILRHLIDLHHLNRPH